MVTLEKIRSPLFANLYNSFLNDDDPLSGEQDWRNIFDYQFENKEGYCGYAMLDKGQVVGMMGMIFSERVVEGEMKRFCNLHTWWVREDHRGRSLALLRPVLTLKGYTVTHFTPCDIVRAVTKRLGFQDLNSQLKILLPFDLFRRRDAANDPRFIYDEKIIKEQLSAHEKKILLDHHPYGCGHLLINEESENCYVLYTHVVRHRLPYCHIHYISNKRLFAEMEREIRMSLLRRHRARFVAVDARQVQDIEFRRSFNFWAPAHALFKSADVQPEQIDNLYSDVVFLKLTLLPDMSHEIMKLLRLRRQ